MQRIAFDITEFLDAIAANPDIGDIDDAYLNFSTQPKDTNKIVSLIMYKQWEQLLVTSGLQSNVDEYHATLKEGDIENAIVWKRHFIRIGEIGVVTTEGEYVHEIVGTTLFLRYQRTAGIPRKVNTYTRSLVRLCSCGTSGQLATMMRLKYRI
jgi:hypothetical protein